MDVAKGPYDKVLQYEKHLPIDRARIPSRKNLYLLQLYPVQQKKKMFVQNKSGVFTSTLSCCDNLDPFFHWKENTERERKERREQRGPKRAWTANPRERTFLHAL